MNAAVEEMTPGWDGWIGTNNGRSIALRNTSPGEIEIDDIARGLSHVCRFNGQISRWYSVAEHCIWVSELLPPRLRLIGLLHDAAEAYIGDVTSPLKRALGQSYRLIERNVASAIGQRFGLGDGLLDLPQAVKDADRIMLMTERDALQATARDDWGPGYEDSVRLPGFARRFGHPDDAMEAYLLRFKELSGG